MLDFPPVSAGHSSTWLKYCEKENNQEENETMGCCTHERTDLLTTCKQEGKLF